MPASTPLVTTDWVDEHLDDDSIRIVEVDEDNSLYDTGHLPGAIAWNWKSELQHQRRRDIVSRRDFEGLLGRSGIERETTVILYGGEQNWFAANAYWLLRYYGHEHVTLMDGGRNKWIEEGRLLTEARPQIKPTTYRITKENKHLRALQMDIFRHLDNPVGVLVDVRSPDEYAGLVLAPPGLNETAQRAGHIPGAANVPWSEVVRPDGTFKSVAELERLYDSRGVHRNDDVITYCRIGERSSHSWFVLKVLLGYESVRNYDGSWTEWGNLIGAPIDVGQQPDSTVKIPPTEENASAD